MPASSPRDPRSIITPEAFQVAPHLLGLPLASPRRRLAAILVDLLCIGVLTVVTRSLALVLGIVVAGAFVRKSLQRTEQTAGAPTLSRRLSIGCLGVVVALVTIGIWAVVTFDRPTSSADTTSDTIDSDGARVEARQSQAADPLEPRDAQAVRDGVSLYTIEQALEAYTSLRRSGSTDPMDRLLLVALEDRRASEVASDTLLALERQIAELETEARDAQSRLESAEERLDEAVSRGVLSWLTGLLDDLGFGFGWAALYMTVLMSMTKGQTLGKRLLGVRVLRLDGQPINWWVAFERAGGYAAGFATGLLGFAQILWDANRQAIHDRIAGTVVVRDGAKGILDQESTL